MGAPKGNKYGSKTTWKKGQSGNPKGRPTLSEREIAVRDSTIEAILNAIEKFQDMSFREIKKFIGNEKNPIFEIGVATAYVHWIKTGEFSKIDKIHDRYMGKTTTILEHGGSKGNPIELKKENEITYSKKTLTSIEKLLLEDAARRSIK